MRAVLPWVRKMVAKSRSGQTLAAHFRQELRPDRWIFIIGCYNSGTTLLREMLARHPQIAALPAEGVRLTDSLPRPEDFGWNRMWCRCVEHIRLQPGPGMEERCERIRRQWSLVVPGRPTCVLEKSIANTARTPFLQQYFQPAYFVHLVRDGYAVAEGIRRKAQPTREAAREFGQRYPVSLCAQQWRDSLKCFDADRDELGNVLELRYEELTADPVSCLRSITEFLQLPTPADTDALCQFHIHGVQSVIVNMNADSRRRLSAQDCEEIDKVAGEQLLRLGYERD